MARKWTLSLARIGWTVTGDLWTVFQVSLYLMLAGAPLFLWRYLTGYRYADVAAQLAPALLVASLLFAFALSIGILYRLYRFLLRCRVC